MRFPRAALNTDRYFRCSDTRHTLFDQYDFSGKTIIPFNTHMGSRDGGTYKTIRELAPGAEVLAGLPVEMRDAERGPAAAVEKWLAA